MEIMTVAMAFMLFAVGLGLGCTIDTDEFKLLLKKPKAFLVGFCSHYVWMPLIAFLFCHIFSLKNEHAIGLLLLGSAPTGPTTNLLSYLAGGDVALSIAMCAASTLSALFIIPLLAFLFFNTTKFQIDGLKIPFSNIILGLLLIVVPVFFGLHIRKRSALWAKRLEKAAAGIGALFLILALVEGLRTTNLWGEDWNIWLSIVLYQPLGTLVGYLTSALFSLSRPTSRTIAHHTGIENVTLIIALLELSFPGEEKKMIRLSLLVAPQLNAFLYLIHSVWITILFRFVLAKRDSPEEKALQTIGGKKTKVVGVAPADNMMKK